MPPETAMPCGIPGCSHIATPEDGARVVVFGQAIFLCGAHAEQAREAIRGAIRGGLSGVAKVVEKEAPSLFEIAMTMNRARMQLQQGESEEEPETIYVEATVVR